jgi:hypothetical protein
MVAWGRGLISFLWSFAFAYLAATLLASAAAHLVGFADFCDLIRTHGIIPPRLSTAVALGVLTLELVAGAAALLLVSRRGTEVVPPILLCAVTAITGVGFVSYVRRLLQMSTSVRCGCSPLAGPTTSASLLPGAALALISMVGLAVALAPAQSFATELDVLVAVLPQLWGATLAVVVMLVPSSMPAPASPQGIS